MAVHTAQPQTQVMVMLVVNKAQTTLGDGGLVAEASTLGLKPGEWPDFIAVLNDDLKGYLFRRQHQPINNYPSNQFAGYVYVASRGEQLLVYND